jgi:predicted dinucleotide-utilizing enzyme
VIVAATNPVAMATNLVEIEVTVVADPEVDTKATKTEWVASLTTIAITNRNKCNQKPSNQSSSRSVVPAGEVCPQSNSAIGNKQRTSPVPKPKTL